MTVMRSRIAVLLLVFSMAVFGQRKPDTRPARPATELTAEEVEISVEDGYILITLPRQAQVKIFTILGQPVMTNNLGAGTSRLRLPARGIYILKIGAITRRITV